MTRNWNRFDRVFCTWDEFTPNTAINRLFKCACRFLAERVNYLEAARLLLDCQAFLSEVEDVSPVTALRDIGICGSIDLWIASGQLSILRDGYWQVLGTAWAWAVPTLLSFCWT